MTKDGSDNEVRPPPGGTAIVTASAVRSMVPMADAIDAVASAVHERYLGHIITASRTGLPGGGTLLMAAAYPDVGGTAGKIISVSPANRSVGLSTIQGLAAWFDFATGRPLLITDAAALTALRTGALSAVATRALACESASVLAMIGAGGQAMAQVEAVCQVRPVRLVRVVSQHAASAQALCDEINKHLNGPSARVEHDIASAVHDADIVCVATTATRAFLQGADLGPHAHINAVGAYRPDMKEVDRSVFARAALICADDPDGAVHEAGDLMDALKAGDVSPERLFELGSPEVERAASAGHGERLTLFKSVGSSAADLAVLHLLAERAGASGTLQRVHFSA